MLFGNCIENDSQSNNDGLAQKKSSFDDQYNCSIMKNIVLYRWLLGLSLFSLAYFASLVYFSYYPPADTNIFRVIGELITIPLLLITVFCFVFSLYNVVKKIGLKKYLSVLLLTLATIGLLVVA